MSKIKTEQENFWMDEFGDHYIERNNSKELIASNIHLFSNIISKTKGIKSILEFGSNIGTNLIALGNLIPECELSAIEINKKASQIAVNNIGKNLKMYNQSILDFEIDYKRNLVFTKGVLIHINPDELQNVYEKLYQSSNQYILVCEYYNITPVNVVYRGFDNKLFKRNFCGEIMEKYPDLELVDYGFAYHKDASYYCKQDDITWFLMKK